MQKINLREIDPDVYKTDNLMEGAEAVLAVIAPLNRQRLLMNVGNIALKLLYIHSEQM